MGLLDGPRAWSRSTRSHHCFLAMARQVRGNFRGLVSCRHSITSIISGASGGTLNMSIGGAYIKLSIALASMSVALFTTSAFGQSPATTSNSRDKGIAVAQGPKSGNQENK